MFPLSVFLFFSSRHCSVLVHQSLEDSPNGSDHEPIEDAASENAEGSGEEVEEGEEEEEEDPVEADKVEEDPVEEDPGSEESEGESKSNHDDDTTLVLGESPPLSPGACPSDSESEDEPPVPASSNGDKGHSVCEIYGAGRMCDGTRCKACHEALYYKTPSPKRAGAADIMSGEKRAKTEHADAEAAWQTFFSGGWADFACSMYKL